MIIVELDGGLVQGVKRVKGRKDVVLVVDRDFDGVESSFISYDREGREFIGTMYDVERCGVIEGKWWMQWVRWMKLA